MLISPGRFDDILNKVLPCRRHVADTFTQWQETSRSELACNTTSFMSTVTARLFGHNKDITESEAQYVVRQWFARLIHVNNVDAVEVWFVRSRSLTTRPPFWTTKMSIHIRYEP